jgi:hypothetical protein
MTYDWTLRDIVELWTSERQQQKNTEGFGGVAGPGNGLMQPLLQKNPVEMLAGLLEAEPLTFILKVGVQLQLDWFFVL